MKYYIDLDINKGEAMVYNDFSRPKDVAHHEKVGASPAEAGKRLLAEEVAAETIWQARDALRAIKVDYEPLPFSVTVDDAR